jgi:two-component system sensor histidine kinase DesK
MRIRLLPAGPLGWTPYAWLVYLGTFLVEPVWRTQSGQAGTLYWAATALAVAVFLVAYFRGHWVHGRQLMPIIGVITAIGVISAPMNAGAAVMFVYAGSFAGYLDREHTALRTLLAVALVAATVCLLTDAPIWSWIVAVGFTMLVGGINIHFAGNARANHRLRLAQTEIEHLAAVAERERIARDLHDVLGHTLSMIVLKSELAARLAPTDGGRAAGEMRDVEHAARAMLQQVRETIRGYHPTFAEELASAQAMLRAARIEADIEIAELTLPRHVEETLALALREAVTNVVRHAAARTCRIRLAKYGADAVLDVSDDGRGSSAPEGVGLRGMRARVEAQGGCVARDGNEGVHLRVSLPLDEREAAARTPLPADPSSAQGMSAGAAGTASRAVGPS